jgi:hypothetical protein
VFECCRDAEPLRCGLGSSGYWIAHGGYLDAILHILHRQVGQNAPHRNASTSHDPNAYFIGHEPPLFVNDLATVCLST